ncbi:membrane protein [Helicobacter pylori]|nr:membrane protein [Helicobacter pylori]
MERFLQKKRDFMGGLALNFGVLKTLFGILWFF